MKKTSIITILALLFVPSVLGATVDTFTSTGSDTWTAPAGVTQISVEVWGGGGAGSNTGTTDGGAGGGGGGYARGLYTVEPGETHNIFVGGGGSSAGASGTESYFSDPDTKTNDIEATGGGGGGGTIPGSGGIGSGPSADVTYSGGDGGFGTTGSGPSGGGGAGAGQNANGADGGSTTGGVGVSPAGSGGAGNHNGAASSGTAIAGGGGGSGGRSAAAGLGARGEVRISYITEPTIQRGTRTLTTGDVVEETIDPIILEKSFVRHTMQSGNSRPDVLAVMSTIEDTETIELSRYYSGPFVAIQTVYSWEVVEDEKITAQRGVESFASTGALTLDISIDSVNTSESFVIVSSRASATGEAAFVSTLWSAELTNSTNLRLQKENGISNSAGEVSWQVIEWEGSKVQSDVTTLSGSSSTISLSESIVPENSFIIINRRLASMTNSNQYAVKGTILNSTHIELSRGSTGGTAYVGWFVVENPRFYVQRGEEAISGSSEITTAINTGLNLTKAFHTSSWDGTAGTATENSAQHLTTTLVGDTTQTNITFQKGTASQTNDAQYDIVHISKVCEPPLLGDWRIRGEENCVVEETFELKSFQFTCEGAGSFEVTNASGALLAGIITAKDSCTIKTSDSGSARAQKENFVQVSNNTINYCGGGGTGTAGVRANTNGDLEERQGGTYTVIDGEWITEKTGGGELWEVRATHLSGDVPTGTLDTWQSLNFNREWSISSSGSNVNSNILLEFRNTDTQYIHDIATITLSAAGGAFC